MSLYGEYLIERTEDRIIETEVGFVTYRFINEKTAYIIDIFIRPDKRKHGLAALLADMVVVKAKERGCTELLGTVLPTTKAATESLKVLLAYGMTLKGLENGLIVFRKDL